MTSGERGGPRDRGHIPALGTNFLKHILTVRGRILRQPAGARHQAKWGGVRWRERTGAPRGLWSGGGAGFAMERASGFGHWAEHSASPDPGAEPAEGVGLRPSRPGQRDIRTARAPRIPPAPPGWRKDWPPAQLCLSPLGFGSLVCGWEQPQLSHLPRGERGLPELWSPGGDGVLDQAGLLLQADSLSLEIAGATGPNTSASPSARPFAFSLGQDPGIYSSAWPLVYLSPSAGCLGAGLVSFPSVSSPRVH